MVKKVFYVLVIIILNFIFINISCYAEVTEKLFNLLYNQKTEYGPNNKDCKLSVVTVGVFNMPAQSSAEDYQIVAYCGRSGIDGKVFMQNFGARINCNYSEALYFRFYKKLNDEDSLNSKVFYQAIITEDCPDKQQGEKLLVQIAQPREAISLDPTLIMNSYASPIFGGNVFESAFTMLENTEEAEQKHPPIAQQIERVDQVLLQKQLEDKQKQLEDKKVQFQLLHKYHDLKFTAVQDKLTYQKDKLMYQLVNKLGNAYKVSVQLKNLVKDLELGENKRTQLSQQQQITDLSNAVEILNHAIAYQGIKNDDMVSEVKKLQQELNQKNTAIDELQLLLGKIKAEIQEESCMDDKKEAVLAKEAEIQEESSTDDKKEAVLAKENDTKPTLGQLIAELNKILDASESEFESAK